MNLSGIQSPPELRGAHRAGRDRRRHPVAVQSMTNTDTNDTEASVAQIERIDRAGGKIVRLTAQGRREGENLAASSAACATRAFDTAVVADIHFLPEVAAIAAQYVDKGAHQPGQLPHGSRGAGGVDRPLP